MRKLLPSVVNIQYVEVPSMRLHVGIGALCSSVLRVLLRVLFLIRLRVGVGALCSSLLCVLLRVLFLMRLCVGIGALCSSVLLCHRATHVALPVGTCGHLLLGKGTGGWGIDTLTLWLVTTRNITCIN
jgi:hypothetical protein